MKQYKLLIVDDEQRFADMLAKRLSLRGCHCDVCYNGQQALDRVRQKNFFLVLKGRPLLKERSANSL